MRVAASVAPLRVTVKVAREPSSTFMPLTLSVGRSSSLPPDPVPSSLIVPTPTPSDMVAALGLDSVTLKVSDPS